MVLGNEDRATMEGLTEWMVNDRLRGGEGGREVVGSW